MMSEFPCIICTKECELDTISCSNCKDWMHRECLGFTEIELKSWSQKKLQFLCSRCCFRNGEFDNEMALSRKMPPRVERKAVVNIKPEELILQCEWRDCNEMFNCMNTFTQHVTMHLKQHLGYTSENGAMLESEIGTDMHCYWRECNGDVDGEMSDYLRHVYFHTFHVKIKCIGALLLEKTGHQPCLYDSRNRNLIPDLPECLECGWDQCNVRFENAELFYRHVQSHADGYPDGNAVEGGCKCHWEGCSVVVKSKHKLKDHFKSHTQEKLVGCPTCGALFSCRTKFFDHLSRQHGYSTGKQYQCSHCNSTFGAERLLRDHMRYHVNQYKCPFCDMTSPSPSNMRLHMKYRHSEDKPFKCDNCKYRCKSMADLRKHLETHNNDGPIKCEVPDCPYKAKNYKYLENHFHRMHEKPNTSYQCHVCDTSFTRGALLTTHLKTKHKFNWPAGHSRFRYKRHSDGKFRLQTVRYESVELTTQDESNSSHNTTASSSGQRLCDMPNLNEPCSSQSTEGIVLVEKLDTAARSDISCGESNICLISVIDAGGQKKGHYVTGTKDGNKKASKNLIDEIGRGKPNSESTSSNITLVAREADLNTNNNSNYGQDRNLDTETVKTFDLPVPEREQEVEEPIEIRIVTNEKGEYMIQNESQRCKETVPVHEKVEFEEETMYNLQMLGDVALQDKYQGVKQSDK